MSRPAPIDRPFVRSAVASVAGVAGAVCVFVPLDSSLDTLPALLIVGGFGMVPSATYGAAAAGLLPRIAWGRRWIAFAVGAGLAMTPWAWAWAAHLSGPAEIPLDEVALLGGSVTAVSMAAAGGTLKLWEATSA